MAKSQTDLTCQIENALSGFPGMIPREQLAKFLGLSRRTLANYDGVGEGPRNPLRIGQKVLYEKSEVVTWLIVRAQKSGKNK